MAVGISWTRIHIYSYLDIATKREFGVKMTELKSSLAVVRSPVLVLRFPGYRIQSPPQVQRTQCFSSLCGFKFCYHTYISGFASKWEFRWGDEVDSVHTCGHVREDTL
jgi:hypothetical protein